MQRFLNTAILVLIVLLLAACDTPLAEWHMVNVNHTELQGDAHILLADDQVFMIDAGYGGGIASKKLVPYLKEKGITLIDRAFVSHPHRDHYEGFAKVFDAGISIKHIHYNAPSDSLRDCCYSKAHFFKYLKFWEKNGAVLHEGVEEGEVFPLGQTTLTVIHAQREDLSDQVLDLNDRSLIMKWQVGETSVLFSGDLNLYLGAWLAKHKPQVLKADWLKVPHHGGWGIAPKSFFEAVGAKNMMVPGPAWIWCGERGAQVRSFAKEKGVQPWVNGLHGSVVGIFYKDRVTTSADKNDVSCPP